MPEVEKEQLDAPFVLACTLSHVYQNGSQAERFSIVESLGGGVGLIDFDLDGMIDICLPGGGEFQADNSLRGLPTRLFRNILPHDSNWFNDVSTVSRIEPATCYTHGVAVGDFDNDGFDDLLITGYQGAMLWHNQGDGTFVENEQSSEISHVAWGASAAWGDLNNDGDLDLYIANYVNWSNQNNPICKSFNGLRDICPPRDFEGLDDAIFQNQGDGSFLRADSRLQLSKGGKGLGVVLADFNDDRWLDIYVANDTTANFLYLNQSGISLEESGQLRGAALDDRGVPNGSMGAEVIDYNADGLLDIFVTNYEEEHFAIYKNLGDAFFMHSSHTSGITSIGNSFVGFGTAAIDYDLDGDQDLVITNGHVILHPQRSTRAQTPVLLENRNSRFEKVRFRTDSYFAQTHEGRGLARGDMDNDGCADLVLTRLNQPSVVMRNQAVSTRHLRSKLVGRQSNRNAIGSKMTLTTNMGTRSQFVQGGGSYLSAHDLRIYWGLKDQEVPQQMEIRWPSGKDTLIDVSSGRDFICIE